MPGVLVITPTYNEVESLPTVVAAVRSSVPDAHVLVIDDNSPDGTGDRADQLAIADDHIHVLRRAGKLGLGTAYVTGFDWALRNGYDVVIEMDADGSHPADRLPAMIDAVRSGAGLAIGSRWVAGGSVVDWPWTRELLSKGGNLYARLALGIHVHDATAGFRAYAADTLRAVDLVGIDSRGYCFQIDLVLRVLATGARVVEVPIEFRERTTGVSKMSGGIVAEAMWKVTVWGLQRPGRWLVRRRTVEPAMSGDKVNG